MLVLLFCLLLIGCVLPVSAEQPAANGGVVPSVVMFSGVLTDVNHKPLTGTQLQLGRLVRFADVSRPHSRQGADRESRLSLRGT
jgi:hypothetical protein